MPSLRPRAQVIDGLQRRSAALAILDLRSTGLVGFTLLSAEPRRRYVAGWLLQRATGAALAKVERPGAPPTSSLGSARRLHRDPCRRSDQESGRSPYARAHGAARVRALKRCDDPLIEMNKDRGPPGEAQGVEIHAAPAPRPGRKPPRLQQQYPQLTMTPTEDHDLCPGRLTGGVGQHGGRSARCSPNLRSTTPTSLATGAALRHRAKHYRPTSQRPSTARHLQINRCLLTGARGVTTWTPTVTDHWRCQVCDLNPTTAHDFPAN